FFFSSRRRHTRCLSDWSSDVCSSDLAKGPSVLANSRPDVALREESSVKRRSGTRSKVLSAPTQPASEFPPVKKAGPAAASAPLRLRKFRLAASAPALQLERPFLTSRNSAPAATCRIFKSVSGVVKPEKV